MITKEQIEEAASIQTLDCEEYTGFVAGANWAIEQYPYSQDDIIEFVIWCYKSFWMYDKKSMMWKNCAIDYEDKPTSQLIKEWEIETGRRKT